MERMTQMELEHQLKNWLELELENEQWKLERAINTLKLPKLLSNYKVEAEEQIEKSNFRIKWFNEQIAGLVK
jgi:hypothetical protein